MNGGFVVFPSHTKGSAPGVESSASGPRVSTEASGRTSTLGNFRRGAWVLIVFNLIGTLVTWTDHLAKPGTANAHAFIAGTEFTSPVLFTLLWIVFVLLTLRKSAIGRIGAILMTVSALVFLIGETSELFKSNVGLSSGKWDFVLGASGVGIVLAVATLILGIRHLVRPRTA